LKKFSEKPSLVEDVHDYLRDSIINLSLKPGEQLNELALIKKLGVSRSPLREAFRLLEAEGFVIRYRGRGVYVREVTANDVTELFPIRAALESLAAELAASRLTKKELQDIEKITQKMEQVAEKGDIRAYGKLNFDFHREIVKGARNKRLEEMIKNAGRQSMWFFFATLYFKKSLNYAMGSHREVYLALKSRDGKRAAECVKNHINNGARDILEYFPLKGKGQGEKE
jgi:DNA-binding GntR family transcriptional regulator